MSEKPVTEPQTQLGSVSNPTLVSMLQSHETIVNQCKTMIGEKMRQLRAESLEIESHFTQSLDILSQQTNKAIQSLTRQIALQKNTIDTLTKQTESCSTLRQINDSLQSQLNITLQRLSQMHQNKQQWSMAMPRVQSSNQTQHIPQLSPYRQNVIPLQYAVPLQRPIASQRPTQSLPQQPPSKPLIIRPSAPKPAAFGNAQPRIQNKMPPNNVNPPKSVSNPTVNRPIHSQPTTTEAPQSLTTDIRSMRIESSSDDSDDSPILTTVTNKTIDKSSIPLSARRIRPPKKNRIIDSDSDSDSDGTNNSATVRRKIQPLQSTTRKRKIKSENISPNARPPAKKQRLNDNISVSSVALPSYIAQPSTVFLVYIPADTEISILSTKLLSCNYVPLSITVPLKSDVNGGASAMIDGGNNEVATTTIVRRIRRYRMKTFGVAVRDESDEVVCCDSTILRFTANNALFFLWARQWLHESYPNHFTLEGQINFQQKKKIAPIVTMDTHRKVAFVFLPIDLARKPIRIPFEVLPNTTTHWKQVNRHVSKSVAKAMKCDAASIHLKLTSPVCIGPTIGSGETELYIEEMASANAENSNILIHFAAPINNASYINGCNADECYYPYFTYSRPATVTTDNTAVTQIYKLVKQCLHTIGGQSLIHYLQTCNRSVDIRYWRGYRNAESLFDLYKSFLNPWKCPKLLTDTQTSWIFDRDIRPVWKCHLDVIVLFDHQMYEIVRNSLST